jgi:hypothetical protein
MLVESNTELKIDSKLSNSVSKSGQLDSIKSDSTIGIDSNNNNYNGSLISFIDFRGNPFKREEMVFLVKINNTISNSNTIINQSNSNQYISKNTVTKWVKYSNFFVTYPQFLDFCALHKEFYVMTLSIQQQNEYMQKYLITPILDINRGGFLCISLSNSN